MTNRAPMNPLTTGQLPAELHGYVPPESYASGVPMRNLPLYRSHVKDGVATTTTAARILEGPVDGCYKISLITLHNPNASALGFVLRRVSINDDKDEVTTRRFDESMPANDTWTFGTLGARMTLAAGQRLELLLDSAPANPVEYGLEFIEDY